MFIIYDNEFPQIYGLVTTEEKAKQVVDKLSKIALREMLSTDSEDSGIYWEEMSEKEKSKFIENEIKCCFLYKEFDCNVIDYYGRKIIF